MPFDMLTTETIYHTAHLAGLHLTPEQALAMQTDLNQILEWVAILQTVDTTGVAPLIYPIENLNTWAEDTAIAGFTREEALQNAPQKNDTHFLVPKVL